MSGTFVVIRDTEDGGAPLPTALMFASDELTSVMRGAPLPTSWLTFRDEDQPFGWPELDA